MENDRRLNTTELSTCQTTGRNWSKLGGALVAAYQRALPASLHPAGPARLRGSPYLRALRLWISRETLLTRYGAVRATPRDETLRSAGGDTAQRRSPTDAHRAQRTDKGSQAEEHFIPATTVYRERDMRFWLSS